MDEFIVKTEVYSGPLEYLLELIYKNEIDPLKIPISFLIDSILLYLKRGEWKDLSRSMEFLLMIALLMHLKISRFLPSREKREEEEVYVSVEEITREYQKFMVLTDFLEDRKNLFENLFPRGEIDRPEEFEVDVFSLYRLFSQIMSEIREEKIMVQDIPKIEEMMDDIIKKLREKKRLRFKEIFKKCRTRIEVIVYFLAILELLKNKRIAVRQKGLFSEIYVYLV